MSAACVKICDHWAITRDICMNIKNHLLILKQGKILFHYYIYFLIFVILPKISYSNFFSAVI